MLMAGPHPQRFWFSLSVGGLDMDILAPQGTLMHSKDCETLQQIKTGILN